MTSVPEHFLNPPKAHYNLKHTCYILIAPITITIIHHLLIRNPFVSSPVLLSSPYFHNTKDVNRFHFHQSHSDSSKSRHRRRPHWRSQHRHRRRRNPAKHRHNTRKSKEHTGKATARHVCADRRYERYVFVHTLYRTLLSSRLCSRVR